MSGPCAKVIITCTLIAPDGQRFVGTNLCENPQKECPRGYGEGYEKCKSICKQVGHAEITALLAAGEKSAGATAVLSGHTYYCRECQEALFGAGVAALSMRGRVDG